VTAPGDFDLATAGWFYGIWICLFLILLILILLIFAKKYTDKNWEEKGTVCCTISCVFMFKFKCLNL